MLALGTVLLVRVLARSTMAFGQKCGAGNCWGYRLEQYRVSNQTGLAITGSWGMRLEYSLAKMLVESVSEDRWLAGDRAIYLNFRFEAGRRSQRDGHASPGHLRFSSGANSASIPPRSFGRAPDYRNADPARNWLTDAEFQSAITRLEQ